MLASPPCGREPVISRADQRDVSCPDAARELNRKPRGIHQVGRVAHSHDILARGDPASETAAAGDLAGDVVEPCEPVRWQFDGGGRRAAGHRHLGEPPRAAGIARLEQQVVVPPGGIIRGAGVLKDCEAWHRGCQ